MRNLPFGSLLWSAAVVIGSAAMATAAPTLMPYNGVRVITGQKFDIRAENTTSAAAGAISFTIDGVPVTATSNDTVSGFVGYNIRGYSFTNNTTAAQTHTIIATDTSGSTTTTVTVINPFGSRQPAKNIIILVGDGMGIAHRSAARIVQAGIDPVTGRAKTLANGSPVLAMDRMPNYAMINTYSGNSIVTDSAPGMANYVTGVKAYNNQEGVFNSHVANPFYAPRIEYLSEYLHRTRGKSLGIVSTADIEDATPAANAIHTLARGNGTGICDQYLDESANTGLTVLLGGGRRWFLPSGTFGSSRTSSNDYASLPADLQSAWNAPAGALDATRDLIGDFQNAGFTYTADRTALLNNAAGATKLLGLFGYGNMNVALDKLNKQRGVKPTGSSTYVVDDYFAPDQPMLDEMTDAALTVLNKNSNGFVLMVEGAHIDKQSHLMDADRAILETIEFDKAVNRALLFADNNPNTLVIVTADHECSGFSIIGGLSGGIANARTLASDTANTSGTNVGNTTGPRRQGIVGTYDVAGFPAYTIAADGYPASTRHRRQAADWIRRERRPLRRLANQAFAGHRQPDFNRCSQQLGEQRLRSFAHIPHAGKHQRDVYSRSCPRRSGRSHRDRHSTVCLWQRKPFVPAVLWRHG